MKKSNKKSVSSKTMSDGVAAVGLDLSDRTGRFYAIDEEGLKISEGTVLLVAPELQRWAKSIAKTVIAIEAGTHSPWTTPSRRPCLSPRADRICRPQRELGVLDESREEHATSGS